MKRRYLCIPILTVILVCTVFAMNSYSSVSVEENAKADAEYGSCEVHTYDTDYIVISEPTCANTGMKWRACTVCGYRDIVETAKDKTNHTGIQEDWLYFPAPTCTKGGTKYKVCYSCNGHVEVTDVPADPEAHVKSGETAVVIEANCAAEGTVADVCKECGQLFNHTKTAVNPDNHITSDDSKWEMIIAPTCSAEGTMVCYCDNCGEVAITKTFSASGYHYHDDVLYTDKEANCTEPGIMSYHCVECGMSMEEQEIPVEPDAHTYTDDFVVDTAATCISTGEKSKHCIYCDKKIDVTEIPVDISAHAYSDEWTVTKEATCSEMGLKHTVCTLCGEESIPVAVQKTDHSYGDYEIVQESADGLSARVKYTCTVCSYEKEDIITLGDNSGDGDIGDGSTKYFKLKLTNSSVLVVDYDNFIISNVAGNMTVEKFNSNFTNSGSCVIYDTKAKIISEEDIIATGYRVNYSDVSGIVTNYRISVTGDLDSDGKITAADARLILRSAASLENFENAFFTAADVDSDGRITASDARKTLRVSAKIDKF